MFAKNVGTTDRWLRIIAGIALMAGFFATWNPIFLIGAPILLTGIFSTCWLYSLLKVSTRREGNA